MTIRQGKITVVVSGHVLRCYVVGTTDDYEWHMIDDLPDGLTLFDVGRALHDYVEGVKVDEQREAGEYALDARLAREGR